MGWAHSGSTVRTAHSERGGDADTTAVRRRRGSAIRRDPAMCQPWPYMFYQRNLSRLWAASLQELALLS